MRRLFNSFFIIILFTLVLILTTVIFVNVGPIVLMSMVFLISLPACVILLIMADDFDADNEENNENK